MINHETTISRREWALVSIFALVTVVFMSWPWLTAESRRPVGTTHLGTNIPDVIDAQVYYAFIQANAAGSGLYRNLFTAEPQPAVLVNPLWWTLGRAVALTGWSPISVFWLAKALFGFVLILGVYRVVATFFVGARWRFLGLGLAVFGGGLGWAFLFGLSAHPGLIWVYQDSGIAAALPIDLTYSSAYIWMAILHSPLFTLSIGLVLAIWWMFIDALQNPRRLYWAGGATLLLGFVHPYDLTLVVGGIIGAILVGIMRGLVDQTQVKIILRNLGVLGLWMVPPALYYGLLLLFVPAIQGWNEQNVLPTTNLRTVVAGLAPGILLSVLGLRAWWRRQPQRAWIVMAWIGSSFVLMYFPFLQYQAKMILGLSIPLALLATAGLQKLWRRGQGWGKIISTIAVMCMVATPGMFIARTIDSQRYEPRYHYASNNLLASLQWIEVHTPTTTIVLGDVWTGNLVPRYAQRPTYLGHLHQTANFEQKLSLVRDWFFENNDAPAEKLRWLYEQGIDYIVFGSFERRQGTFDPTELKGLGLVFTAGDVSVWRVDPKLGE